MSVHTNAAKLIDQSDPLAEGRGVAEGGDPPALRILSRANGWRDHAESGSVVVCSVVG
jgi:hypothetical protein